MNYDDFDVGLEFDDNGIVIWNEAAQEVERRHTQMIIDRDAARLGVSLYEI